MGPLYGNSAVQYGQPMTNTRPSETAVTQQVTWTAGNEMSAPPSGTAPQAATTPGLLLKLILSVFILVVRELLSKKPICATNCNVHYFSFILEL